MTDFDGEDRRQKEHWAVDKRIPLALIVALFLQTFGAIWWAAQMDSRVNTLEQLAVKNGSVEARLSRIEESQSWIKRVLERVEQKLP